MRRIPPQVSLRALREAHGLTSGQLAVRIAEHGVPVGADALLNVELGHKRASRRLLTAWARALLIHPTDISQHEDLAQRFQDVSDSADPDLPSRDAA